MLHKKELNKTQSALNLWIYKFVKFCRNSCWFVNRFNFIPIYQSFHANSFILFCKWRISGKLYKVLRNIEKPLETILNCHLCFSSNTTVMAVLFGICSFKNRNCSLHIVFTPSAEYPANHMHVHCKAMYEI